MEIVINAIGKVIKMENVSNPSKLFKFNLFKLIQIDVYLRRRLNRL